MFTSAFWKATFERAVKTAAQAAATIMSVDWAGWFEFQANARSVLGTAGLAAVASVLSSVASSGIGTKGSPSLAAEAEVEAAS